MGIACPHLHAGLAIRHEDVLPERAEPFVMLELLAPIVLLRAAAQHLDDQRGVRHRELVLGVSLSGTAYDRDVGVSREAGRRHTHAQIGVMGPASPRAKL